METKKRSSTKLVMLIFFALMTIWANIAITVIANNTKSTVLEANITKFEAIQVQNENTMKYKVYVRHNGGKDVKVQAFFTYERNSNFNVVELSFEKQDEKNLILTTTRGYFNERITLTLYLSDKNSSVNITRILI